MRPVYFLLACGLFLSACGASPQAQALQTAQAATATASFWTPTPTASPTLVPTPTATATPVGLITAHTCENIKEVSRIGDGILNVLLYSPDGHWLAAASSGGLTLYDAASLKPLWTVRTPASLVQIAFSPQGETLSGVDVAVNLYQWQVADGSQLLAKKPEDIDDQLPMPASFALAPDGSSLYVPYFDDAIHIYRMSDASLTGRIEQFLSVGETIDSAVVSPDMKNMLSLSINGDVRLWSLTNRKLSAVLKFDKVHRFHDLVFATDGKALFNFDIRDGQQGTRVLDLASRAWGQTFKQKILAVTTDKFMLSRSPAGLDLQKFGSSQVSGSLPEQAIPQGKIASSPDGAFLAIGTSEGIHVWQMDGATLLGTIPGRYAGYSSLALSTDGETLAAGNRLGVEILSRANGSLIRALPLQAESPIKSLAFAPAGDLLAGAQGKSVFVWDVSSGKQLWSLETEDPLTDLAFSMDGSLLVGAYSQQMPPEIGDTVPGLISLWDANNGNLVQLLEGGSQFFSPGYSDLVFSADGLYLLAGQDGGDIELWSVKDWSLVKTLTPGSFLQWSPQLAFAPDGKGFASGADDRQVQLWNLSEKKPVRIIDVKKDAVSALVYSPDGKIIASGNLNDVDLWDTDTGHSLCTLSGSGNDISAIFFTADARFIVTLARDGVIRLWGIP